MPRSLKDIGASLGLSKGSVSTGTRHLVSLGVIRQVWVPGEPRDYYESVGDISAMMESVYRELFQSRLGAEGRALLNLNADLAEDRAAEKITEDEAEFCRVRLKSLVKLRERVDKLAPLAENVLFNR